MCGGRGFERWLQHILHEAYQVLPTGFVPLMAALLSQRPNFLPTQFPSIPTGPPHPNSSIPHLI